MNSRTTNLNTSIKEGVILNDLLIKRNLELQKFEIDVFIKHGTKDITDPNKSIILNPKGTLVENLITIVDDSIDYKDIIMDTVNLKASDIFNPYVVDFLEVNLYIKPIVISGSILRFANIYQYNKYISYKKNIFTVPDKYKDMNMIKSLINYCKINNIEYSSMIPEDFKIFL